MRKKIPYFYLDIKSNETVTNDWKNWFLYLPNYSLTIYQLDWTIENVRVMIISPEPRMD